MRNDPLRDLAQAWRKFRRYLRAATRSLREGAEMESVRERFPELVMGRGVIIKGADRFFPGRSVFIDHRAYLNCAGGDWNNHAGYIRTGDRVEIGPFCVMWGAGGITLGNNVHIAAHVNITAHTSLHVLPDVTDIWEPLRMEFKPVVIEDNVLICSQVSIAPGVRIGHHAQIGSGSVVLNDIPPYALAAGVPARVIRFTNMAEIRRENNVAPLEPKVVDIPR